MADGRGTAADQLRRMLYLLPAASERPLRLSEAAERLGVDVQTVIDDLSDVTARAFYHPAGSAEDVRVEVDGDSVRVHSHDKFRRPVRLNPREALATHLALRRIATDAPDEERVRIIELADRIASELATDSPGDLVERFAVEESGDSGGIRLALQRAARDRLRCRILYVRADGEEAIERTLDPYVVAVSDGTWYAVGYCGLREGVRVFRADRIVDLEVTSMSFDVPDEFDVSEFLEGGRVFRAEATRAVTVRYTGMAAARMRERGPVESGPGGAVDVVFEVADAGWIVRHVLQQAGEAVVVEPGDVREEVARVAARLAG